MSSGIDEQTPTPLLGDDDDSTAPSPSRLPIIAAIIVALLIASAALGGLAYLTGQLIDRPAEDPPTMQFGSALPPPELPAAADSAPNADPTPSQAGKNDAAVSVEELEALREQVRALSDRVSDLGTRFQEQADMEQRIGSLEQLLEKIKQDQEILAQRVENHGKRLDAIVVPPRPARSPGPTGSSGKPAAASLAASTARPPFTVMGVDFWGGVAQVSISRAAGTTWLSAGESLDGWEVIAIQGREVVWRTPAGQTATQQVGGP